LPAATVAGPIFRCLDPVCDVDARIAEDALDRGDAQPVEPAVLVDDEMSSKAQ
jgi:hypothetical protein